MSEVSTSGGSFEVGDEVVVKVLWNRHIDTKKGVVTNVVQHQGTAPSPYFKYAVKLHNPPAPHLGAPVVSLYVNELEKV